MSRPIALVTGASAGIGAAFARSLARRGHDLILVARREAALQALATEVQAAHGIRAEVIPMDLLKPDAPTTLAASVAERGLQVDVLINNAGFGMFGDFAEADAARVRELLELNVVALTGLAHAFIGPMVSRKRGAMVNVASVAAFQGVPHFAVYAASKAYVLAFSEAIAEEVAAAGVTVQALCPGTTRSEFFDVAGMPEEARSRYMSAEAVVEISLDALKSRQHVVVPGLKNTVMTRGGRALPRRALTKIAGKMMKP
jgi:short-subunit dehydrogenase